jgi:hypothetical protein
MTRSKFLSLGLRDILHGFIVTVGATAVSTLVPVLQNGVPTTQQWKQIGIAGVAAGIAYLGKKLFTNSNGELKDETK